MSAPNRFRWLYAALCVLLVLAFVVQLARFHHPVYGFTSLIQIDFSSEPAMLRELRDRPTYVYRDTGGYDGQYYAQIAVKPTLRDPALLQAIDNLGYRARRSLGSWTAWLLALGEPSRALDLYTLVNPFCWLVLAGLLLFVFPPRTLHDFVAWAGLLCSAGVLASVRFALTDLPALTLILAAALAVQRSRPGAATAWLAAAVLARETSLLAFPIFRDRSWRTTFVRGALCVLPLGLWYAYIRLTLGPGSEGWDNLTWPGVTFLRKWGYCLGDLGNEKYALLAWTTLLSMIALTVQGVWLVVRPAWQNLWWRLGIGHVGLMLMLGWAPWEGYPGAATRVLLPMQLAFNAVAPRTRKGLLLLVVGNLSVASGVLSMFDIPRERDEWAADRIEGVSYVAQLGPGWHRPEHHRSRRWCWADQDATLRLQEWHSTAPVRLEFNLHSFAAPRTVTVRQGERVLWRGRVDKPEVAVVCDPVVFAADGTAELQFTSEESAVKEHGGADARSIAFSISDFRFIPLPPSPR